MLGQFIKILQFYLVKKSNIYSYIYMYMEQLDQLVLLTCCFCPLLFLF